MPLEYDKISTRDALGMPYCECHKSMKIYMQFLQIQASLWIFPLEKNIRQGSKCE